MSHFIEITSATNSLIKETAKLKKKKGKLEEGETFLLEGLRLCQDTFVNHIPVKKAFLTTAFKEKHLSFATQIENSEIEAYLITDFLGEKLGATKSPQGVFFVCEVPTDKTLDSCVSNKENLLILDGISDPGNLGTIVRTAVSFGLKDIVLLHNCTYPYWGKTIRASMGAVLHTNFYFNETVESVKEFSDRNNYTIYCSALGEKSVSLQTLVLQKPFALVIGSEATGVSEKVLNSSDVFIKIPMSAQMESLNAASAAAILLWEFTKTNE